MQSGFLVKLKRLSVRNFRGAISVGWAGGGRGGVEVTGGGKVKPKTLLIDSTLTRLRITTIKHIKKRCQDKWRGLERQVLTQTQPVSQFEKESRGANGAKTNTFEKKPHFSMPIRGGGGGRSKKN